MESTSTPPPTWFRGFIQGKTRITIAWIFAGLLVFSAREYPAWPGAVVCFLGASLRYWASGFLRKDSRPAVGGPYAFVRNPLYLGTYLMALGTAASTGAWALLGAMSVVFGVLYHFIILDEETKLQRIFGAPYGLYCQKVARFFPKPWPAPRAALEEINPEPSHHRFSFELARKNKAMEAYWSFLALMGLVAFVAWGWKTLF
jgi:hypothetical protein